MLVWPVLGFGAEIWGWKEREVEKLQKRYVRWVLGADWRTPGYMVREESQWEKLGYRAGKRSMKFEEKLNQGRGGELAQKCWKEIIDRGRRDGEMTACEKERKDFYKDKGVDLREIGTDGRIELDYDKIEREDKKRQEEDRWSKIIESNYNECHREIKSEGLPKYLTKGWGENRWRRIARFRLGNEVR